jgi:hypothetical protein
MPRYLRQLLVTSIVGLFVVPVLATPPSPIVSSLFVPIEGDILEPGTTNLLHLTGEVHVLTQVSFSDSGVPSVGIWANLVRVRGTSQATGITYLAVGAGNVAWVGTAEIPQQELDFALVNLGVSPRPPNVPPSPIVPVFFRNFVFGAEDTNFGKLQRVDVSFEN